MEVDGASEYRTRETRKSNYNSGSRGGLSLRRKQVLQINPPCARERRHSQTRQSKTGECMHV